MIGPRPPKADPNIGPHGHSLFLAFRTFAAIFQRANWRASLGEWDEEMGL